MVGCTNPIGPSTNSIVTVFVQKEPWEKPEGAQKDSNDIWWVKEAGEWPSAIRSQKPMLTSVVQ